MIQSKLDGKTDWSSNTLFLIETWRHFGTGVAGMTHVIKCLLHKHEDLSLSPKQKKPDMVVGVCSPSTKEAEDKEALGTYWLSKK